MTRAIRAFVLTGPQEFSVQAVPAPSPIPGEAIVDVTRVGLCGTDVEFFTGEMPYLKEGHSRYPIQLGHEWAGVVSAVGAGVDPQWIGRRVVGDTMLGDGVCRRCQQGHQHVCAKREEVGVVVGVPEPSQSNSPYRSTHFMSCPTPLMTRSEHSSSLERTRSVPLSPPICAKAIERWCSGLAPSDS